jgi:UDP-N-acetylmuramate dehydrogenase
VGGDAEVLFRPEDTADLITFLTHRPKEFPILVIGVGSNLLVRDGGIPGIVIRLGKGFSQMVIKNETLIVGAGALDRTVALVAAEAGLGGLEFLSGIPGTIGGGLRMNAGAYGQEIKDVVAWAEAVDLEGQLHHLLPEDLAFSYRHCGVPKEWIFVRACLKAFPADRGEIQGRIQQIQEAREETQPVKARTGGSTFANPPGHKAWELIAQAGCRGMTLGGAQVSEKHCNFLLNVGGATAVDLEDLAETVRDKVLAQSGVPLQWEIQRVGVKQGNS